MGDQSGNVGFIRSAGAPTKGSISDPTITSTTPVTVGTGTKGFTTINNTAAG
jgi:hypothetical protein